jgi:hypothetical protein
LEWRPLDPRRGGAQTPHYYLKLNPSAVVPTLEVIVAAALGTGLLRRRQGIKALNEITDGLHEIERGDGLFNCLLIGFISLVSRMRLPDAGRVAFYHRDFLAAPLGAWRLCVDRVRGASWVAFNRT